MDNLHCAILTVLLSPFLGLLLLPIKARHRSLYYAFMLLVPAINIATLAFTKINDRPIAFGSIFIFSLDHYSFLFILLLNFAWMITICYTMDYIRYRFQEKIFQFYGWLFVSIAMISATALADNIFTLIFFYILAIPVGYPLISIGGSKEAKNAGFLYLVSTGGPAIMILLPVFFYLDIWTTPFQSYSIKDILENDGAAAFVLALIIIGFSKCCVAPFYAWLPRSAISPAPVSALIHSVGSVHTGTIAVLKIALFVYGGDYLARLSEDFFRAGWLIYLCGFTSLYTAYRAYKATNLKERFSYSTVGQLSYIITAILIGTNSAVQGAILHIVSHTIAKMNLFFIVGAFASLYGVVEATQIRNFVPHMKWLALATGISGLSITGLPILAGYYSKDLMLLAQIHTHQYAAAFFLVIGSIMNFFYIYPVLQAAVFGKRLDNFEKKKLPPGMSFAIGVCCVLILLFSQYVYWLIRYFQLG